MRLNTGLIALMLTKMTFSKNLIWLVIGIFIAGGWFYWYQWRPSQIKSDCVEIAANKARELLKTKVEIDSLNSAYKRAAEKNLYLRADYDSNYKVCLQQHGL